MSPYKNTFLLGQTEKPFQKKVFQLLKFEFLLEKMIYLS